MSSNTCTLHGLLGVETIKWQTRAVCGCLAVRLACVCRLSLLSIGCMLAQACDVQRCCSLSCHYMSVMSLPLHFCACVVSPTLFLCSWLGSPKRAPRFLTESGLSTTKSGFIVFSCFGLLSCVLFCVIWFCLLAKWLAGKTYSCDIFRWVFPTKTSYLL